MVRVCPSDGHFGPGVGPCRSGFDLTLTFEESILGLAPQLIFLLLAPIRVLTLRRRRIELLKDSYLGFLKDFTNGLYMISCVILLIFWCKNDAYKTRVSIASSCIELASSIALAAVSRVEHTRALRPSHLLQFFLSMVLLCNAVQLRTLFLMRYPNLLVVSASIHTFLVGFLLVLESLDKTPLIPPERRATLAPEDTLGLFTQKFFWHLNSLFKRGYRKVLTPTDLHTLSSEITSEELRGLFREAWRARMETNGESKWIIYASIWDVLKKDIMISILPRLCYMLTPQTLGGTTLAQPYLIKAMIRYIEDREASLNYGYGLIAAFALNYTLMAICNGWYYQSLALMSTKLRSCLVSLIYHRTLLIHPDDADVGAGTVLMNVDVELVMDGSMFLHEFWILILTFSVALYILYAELGMAFIAPTVVSILIILVCYQLGTHMKPRQRAWTDAIEKRVVAISYAVSNFKAIRMLGLSSAVYQNLTQLRERDVDKNLSVRKLKAIILAIANSVFQVATLVTYVTYVVLSLTRSSSGFGFQTLFGSLAALKLVTTPLVPALQWIGTFTNSMSSLERIQSYLKGGSLRNGPSNALRGHNGYDVELKAIPRSFIASTTAPVIKLINASFGIEKGHPLIRNLDLQISRGTLNMLIGRVGSGKSLLLRALIGEMRHEGGISELNTTGVAYCAPTPWLKNASIYENIVSESEFDEEWYERVIRACVLHRDFDELPRGDRTLVGSKGISLSGGQKNRICLARALYSRSAVLIIDDVLSGLDKTTEGCCFQRVFGPQGLLRSSNCTVILATHAVHFASYSDQVIIIREGTIIASAPYDELKSNPNFDHIQSEASHDKVEAGYEEPEKEETSPRSPETKSTATKTKELDEERRSGDKRAFLYYLSSVGLKHVSIYIILCAASSAATAATTVWLKIWAQNSNQRRVTTIRNTIIFTVINIINIAVIAVWLVHFCTVVIQRSSLTMHARQLKALMRASLAFIVSTDTGSITNRFSQDIVLVDSQLPSHWVNVTAGVADVIVASIFIAIATPPVAALIPLVGLVSYAIQRVYLRTSRQIRLMDLELKAPLCTNFLETLAGIMTVRAFGWTEKYREKNNFFLDKSQAPFYLLRAIQNWLKLVLELMVAGIVTAIVGLAVVLRLKIDPGFLGLALVNSMDLGSQIMYLVMAWTGLETSLSAISRIRQFSTETPKEETDARAALHTPKDWPLHGSVRYKNFTASYSPTSDAVLNDISLEIRSGEKIGICGRTGSGKSSLVASLFGLLHEQAGQIEIDNVRTADVSLNDLRTSIVALPQEPFLLNDWTLRQNLGLQVATSHDASKSDSKLLEALDEVGLKTRLAGLAGHESLLDMPMKEVEGSLSQGEKQLFCLARAAVSEGRIVVLDEATSSVDMETEKLMQDILRVKFANRTVIAIAHRLGTILDFDRIVVMDAGRIVEVGPPGELMKSGGRFSALVNQQGL